MGAQTWKLVFVQPFDQSLTSMPKHKVLFRCYLLRLVSQHVRNAAVKTSALGQFGYSKSSFAEGQPLCFKKGSESASVPGAGAGSG